MTRTFAVRLETRVYQTIARLARQRGTTLSDAVREALEGWIAHVRNRGQRLPYVVMADLVGAVDSDPVRPRPRRAPRRTGAGRNPRPRARERRR